MTRPALMHCFALLALAAAAPQAALAGSSRPRAAARPAQAITPARLVGRWGDNGDCSKDVTFRGDGTFRSFNGGEGSWRLVGERLTMTGQNGATELMVHLIDPNRVRIGNPDGSVGISQRC